MPFYESMRIDTSLQFDFLLVTVRRYHQKQNHKSQNLEASRLLVSESIAERIPDSIVESNAETLPKMTVDAEDALQLLAECFAESFA